MDPYFILKHAHSGLGWIVLLLFVIVIIKSFIGMSGSKYEKLDNILSASLLGTVHLQLLIGILLYFIWSPLGLSAFENGIAPVMKNSLVRKVAVEHLVLMFIAAVIAQIGRIKSKKAMTDQLKFKLQAIFYLIAFVLILLGIPWSLG